jgi:RNA polymerase sigma-70 factor (ECF subfamily)
LDSPTEGEFELERFRDYLSLLARLEIDARLQGKIDLSGVVQQTFLEAHQASDQLVGRCDDEQLRWLRRALANNLADEIRRLRAEKRDVARERSLEQAIEESSSRLQAWLAVEDPSPPERVAHHEQTLTLVATLARLPDRQRQAVEMRHLKGLSLAQIAAEMECTKATVVGLLHRGVENLRSRLTAPDNE